MADEKKIISAKDAKTTASAPAAITAPEVKKEEPAAKKVAAKPAAKKEAAKPAAKKEAAKPAAKKEAAKKEAAKPAAKKEAAKPAAKKEAAKPAAKKEAAKPAAKKEKAARKPRAAKEITLDTLTTSLWKKLEKANIDSIKEPVAIQVNVYNLGVFYIAVNTSETDKKQIMQAPYYMNDAEIECSAEEVLKIASAKYDFIKAVKAGNIKFYGNLAKGLSLMELF